MAYCCPRISQYSRPARLLYILENSVIIALVVEDLKTLQKLVSGIQDLPIQLVVLLSDETPEASNNLTVFNFSQVMAKGQNQALQPVAQNRETLATLLYTSGTTGKPTGVMLSSVSSPLGTPTNAVANTFYSPKVVPKFIPTSETSNKT